MSDPIVLIPSRLAATRLPNKPLADIGGEPMIVHVWRRAVEAGIGPVAVATDSSDIAEAVVRAGGQAVMTRTDHASGSDRIFEADSGNVIVASGDRKHAGREPGGGLQGRRRDRLGQSLQHRERLGRAVTVSE